MQHEEKSLKTTNQLPQVGFVHAEDHYWDGRGFKAEAGKAFKSVSLGELEMDDRLRSEAKTLSSQKISV